MCNGHGRHPLISSRCRAAPMACVPQTARPDTPCAGEASGRSEFKEQGRKHVGGLGAGAARDARAERRQNRRGQGRHAVCFASDGSSITCLDSSAGWAIQIAFCTGVITGKGTWRGGGTRTRGRRGRRGSAGEAVSTHRRHEQALHADGRGPAVGCGCSIASC